MLYTKTIEKINWETIAEFCEQRIPEGAYLDYKANFPANLEKTIAAMANTLGGIILIGIREDNENKPILPIEGIPFTRGLSEKVTNIILSNVTPPIFPEIQICRNDEKAIILIRIHQSHQTPHAIANNTRVYLRTANQNKPEELATIKDIFWLNDQRRSSVLLREELYIDSEKTFSKNYNKRIITKKELQLPIENKLDNWLTLSFCPLYPKDYFMDPPEISKIVNDITVNEYYGNGEKFPIFKDCRKGPISKNGTILFLDTNYHMFFTELNCYGLYLYKQNLYYEKIENNTQQEDWISSIQIFSRLDEFFDSSVKFYNKLGYHGPLEFRMFFENKSHRRLGQNSKPSNNRIFETLEDEISFKRIVLKKSIDEQVLKMELLYATVQRIAWAYGWDIQEYEITSYFDKNK
ncbi:ATP-binding protein [bacterium]|nr:ATP-binding protein [bacterium]